jgi:hypothetical protein
LYKFVGNRYIFDIENIVICCYNLLVNNIVGGYNNAKMVSKRIGEKPC